MEHNAQRGMAWFFANDDRIEQLIGLWEVRKKPERAAYRPVKTNGTKGTAAVDQPVRWNCRGCTDPPAVDMHYATDVNPARAGRSRRPDRLSSPQEAHTETIVSPTPDALPSPWSEFDKALKKRREAA